MHGGGLGGHPAEVLSHSHWATEEHTYLCSFSKKEKEGEREEREREEGRREGVRKGEEGRGKRAEGNSSQGYLVCRGFSVIVKYMLV